MVLKKAPISFAQILVPSDGIDDSVNFTSSGHFTICKSKKFVSEAKRLLQPYEKKDISSVPYQYD